MAIAQVVWLGMILIVLYRFLLGTIGVEQLGIWSLVLATTAVTRISDLGISDSVVKFVAKYVARGEQDTAGRVVQTAVVSVGAMVGVILLVAYPFTSWLLSYFIPEASLQLGISILPYAFLSLWLTAITSVFLAGLDGRQRIDLRSWLLMAGTTLHLVLSLVLVPTHGLTGLACGQVIQAGAVLVGSWLLLRKLLTTLPVIPHKWSRVLFKEIVSYGVQVQIISMCRMAYDPITKGLLSRFGGLATVGYYEMASRMVLQFRAVVVAANQVLVPAIAELQETAPETIQLVYRDSYRLVSYSALPLYSAVAAFTPVISVLWIGQYNSEFVLFAILLALGWLLNTFSAPAYFVNLGTGELRWNMWGQVLTGALNVLFGVALGKLFGGIGVVSAWAVSLAVGGGVIILAFHRKHKLPLRTLIPKANYGIMLAWGAALVIAVFRYTKLDRVGADLGAGSGILLLATLAIIAAAAWLHPMRRRVLGWVSQYLLGAEKRR